MTGVLCTVYGAQVYLKNRSWRWTEFNETRKQDLNVPLLILCFRPIGKTRWPPWPLVGWYIFDFSDTTEGNSDRLEKQACAPVQKEVLRCAIGASCFLLFYVYGYLHWTVNLKNATPLTQTKCEKWTLITIHFE